MAFTGLAITSGNLQAILPGATDNSGPNILMVNQEGFLKLDGSRYLVKGHAKSKTRGKSHSKGKKSGRKASKSKGRKKSSVLKNSVAAERSAGRTKSVAHKRSAGAKKPAKKGGQLPH